MGSEFTLTFTQNNAAFTEDPESAAIETARILRQVADAVAAGKRGGKIADINGNNIGEWKSDR